MSRLISIATALATSITLLAAAGGHAQAQGRGHAGYYVAVPVTQPTKTSLLTRSTPWTWTNGAYVAARAPERDQVLCQLVARNTGALASFTVAGKPYDADSLAKCNAKAR